MTKDVNIKAVIEAILFVTSSPVTDAQIKEVLKPTELTTKEIEKTMEEMNQEYFDSKRSFNVENIAGGWRLHTKSQYSSWVKKLLNIQSKDRFSAPALETLAVVAYKQPITKPEIELIRGVNVDWVLRVLLEKGIVRTIGRKDVPGRPFLYGTTRKFLEHFGLGDLKDLPQVQELRPKQAQSA